MIFNNIKKQEHFDKFGYCVIPLLSPAEVTQLLNLFNQTRQDGTTGPFHTTHFSTNYDHKKLVHETIKQVTAEAIGRELPSARIVFSNFMIKQGGGNNAMPMHADWAYVKEPAEMSIAIWIPLIDTDENNGGIGVIPFSQHLSPDIRGPRILQWNPPVAEELIAKGGKLLPMPAGHALIYNHRLLHYSPPNNSSVTRPAINISLVRKGAEVFHYTVPEGTDEIHEFSVENDDFFLRYNNFKMPETGRLIAKHSVNKVPLINAQIPDFLERYSQKSWWQRLTNLLSAQSR